jgi:hypothetical protein
MAGREGEDANGAMTTGQNGADRIRDTSGTYVARYRDGNGLVVEVSTGQRAQGLTALRPLHYSMRDSTTDRAKPWSELTKRRAPAIPRPGLTRWS